MTDMGDDVLGKALAWVDEGRRVAVATVVDTWGSSPRPRGSQLAVRDDGLFVGSVSGGCVEGKVVEAARAAMQDRKTQLFEFGVSNEEAWDVGLACGGTVRILVQPVFKDCGALGRDVLVAIAKAHEEKRAIVLFTPLDGAPTRAWSYDRINAPSGLRDSKAHRAKPNDAEPNDAEPNDAISQELRAAAMRALASDDPQTIATPEGAVLVQAINPPQRLVIVGAVHIAETLARIAALLSYDVMLIDPREAFARAERWPGISVRIGWPDEVMSALSLDHRTAVVALTHDPKIDDPALHAALHSSAFYIGALGSRKTHAARLGRLAERGNAAGSLARIHGPVGLRIGARSPAEIAVSIIGQMTEVLRTAATVATAEQATE